MLKQIYIKTSFEGMHQWLEAPEEVNFLRDYHRHIFNVKVWFEVNHNNRDLEFFIMKKKVNQFFKNSYILNKQRLFQVGSCEMIAQDLLEYFSPEYKVTKVEVNEDGENGVEFIS